MFHVSRSFPRLVASLLPVAIAAVAMPAARAGAQAFNIEFDGVNSPTLPAATFGAAAGQTGSWMRITSAYISGRVLTTTAGEVSAVTLTIGVQGTAQILGYAPPPPANTGDHAALLNDGIEAWTSACESYPAGLSLSVRGLSNGTYDVYTYAARPDGVLAMNTFVDVSGSAGTGRITGIAPSDSFVEGMTHTVHRCTVSNGGLFMFVQDANYDTFLAGLQIVPVSIGDCTVMQQPANQSVSKDQTAVFSAAFTGDVRTYQWMRNGVDLVNARGISGATTPTLTLTEARPSDNGVYSLRYTCGGFIGMTTGATLTVTVPPTADFNHSGGISVQDIFDFLEAYFAGV